MEVLCCPPACYDAPPCHLGDHVHQEARDQLNEVERGWDAPIRHSTCTLLEQPRSRKMELLFAVLVDLQGIEKFNGEGDVLHESLVSGEYKLLIFATWPCREFRDL